MHSQRLTVCFPFVGDTLGGSHISTLLLAENLPSDRYRPLVVLHQEGLLADHLRERGMPYTLLASRHAAGAGSRAGYLRALGHTVPKAAHFLQSQRAAVVHTGDICMHRVWTLAARLSGAKHVWHQRAPYLAPRLGKWLLVSAHSIVTISRYVTESLPETASARVSQIPNPFLVERAVDRAAAREALLASAGLPADATVVGFFGNLMDRKRPHLFAAIARDLLDRGTGALYFPVFGADRDGNAARLRSYAREHGFEDRLLLMGFQTPAERWIAACDLVVAPGVQEGFGRVLVECMQVGTPIVASRTGGHVEIIRDRETGYLAPPDDVRAFADIISSVLSEPAATAETVRRARAHSVAEYSVRAHVRRIERVYEQVLGVASRDPAPDHG